MRRMRSATDLVRHHGFDAGMTPYEVGREARRRGMPVEIAEMINPYHQLALCTSEYMRGYGDEKDERWRVRHAVR